MRTTLISLALLAPALLFGQTKEALPDPYYLLLGKIQSILSAKAITSQQEFYGYHLIWMNARLGKVLRPKGMTRTTEFQTEMVPNDEGITITVGEPFNPKTGQGCMPPFHNTKKKEFLFWVPMPENMVVTVGGLYGKSFSEKLLTALFELTPAPPPVDDKHD